MSRGLPALAAAGSVALLLALLWLGRFEAAGPAHVDLVLPGGVPATLYVPQAPQPGPDLPPPPSSDRRPPGLVLVHGFAGDRAGMSSLARRIATAGYAVLAPDLRGHGENANPFQRDVQWDRLAEDVATAVDWLRGSAHVDGSRIAVAGHSMGASTVLRFAELDSGIDAAIMISGGLRLFGPHEPPNALFLWAEADPPRFGERARRVAARLAGVEQVEVGRAYGGFSRYDAVRTLEIPGADHTTILWSGAATREIVSWLDGAFGMERSAPLELREPRLRALLLGGLALPFALLGLGRLLGGLAPRWPEEDGRWPDLAWLALALLAALAASAATPLAPFLSLDVADVVAGLLLVAGVVILAGLALSERAILLETRGLGRSLAAAGAAALAVHVAAAPLGVVAHRLVLTPSRAAVALAATLTLLPFFLAFESLVRRGPPALACGRAVAGRVGVLAILLLGTRLGVVDRVVTLLVGPLVLVFLIQELVAAGAYAGSRNRLAIAVFESAVLAWFFAALMPML